MRALVILFACLAATRAAPSNPGRISGGDLVEIGDHPYACGLTYGWVGVRYFQACGCSIVNARSIVTAAHCVVGDPTILRWRIRVGSSFADTGGFEHAAAAIIPHHLFDRYTFDNDILMVRSSTNFMFTGIRTVQLPPANYLLDDGADVLAIGWGVTETGQPSEQLREIELEVVNLAECMQTYAQLGYIVTNNMLCVRGTGENDQCPGDDGGPLLHDDIQVGIYSWGLRCGDPDYPSVNTATSAFYVWILANQ